MSLQSQNYQAIFERSPDGILLVDAVGVIREANPMAQQLFGYTRDELEGMSVDRLVPPHVRPDHGSHRDRYS
ncbi:MAG: PAS domain S-box protein, partial [Gemmatimonadetes bacterium]|nr:PAS domain S-box protein [Gemmatimonadota bacterium]